MNEWFLFLLAVLATFRLATMIALEKGPGFIFRWIRRQPPPKSATREGLNCPLCVGVWAAACVTVGLALAGLIEWPYAPLWWLAISGGAVACHFTWTSDFKK